MEALGAFDYLKPATIEDIIAARARQPLAQIVAGGTDLVVNIRRAIVAPPALIDVSAVAELRKIACTEDHIDLGASVTLAEIAGHAGIRAHFPGLADAAGSIAGPTHRHMGTVGGNLCLDTRCIFYNQSHWWRAANNHCLKTTGTQCHVAPKSRGVCFATYSGDLAPALLVLGAEVDLAGPAGRRTVPLEALYIGHARHDGGGSGDGKNFLSLAAGEFVTAVRARKERALRTGYDKLRMRRSIEYPVAGVAVALSGNAARLEDLRVAVTGTNPRPVLLAGTRELCGKLIDQVCDGLDALMRDQIMSMKTTFTPGHYRRRMASVLARRLLRSLATA